MLPPRTARQHPLLQAAATLVPKPRLSSFPQPNSSGRPSNPNRTGIKIAIDHPQPTTTSFCAASLRLRPRPSSTRLPLYILPQQVRVPEVFFFIVPLLRHASAKLKFRVLRSHFLPRASSTLLFPPRPRYSSVALISDIANPSCSTINRHYGNKRQHQPPRAVCFHSCSSRDCQRQLFLPFQGRGWLVFC